jgi:ribokinase
MPAGQTPPTPYYHVVVCGSLHLDIVVHTQALPKIDETAVGSRWEQVCGGKGGNQAVQAAHAGALTAMIGCVGNDNFGRTLKHNLEQAGVDQTHVKTDLQTGSGISVAILQDDGNYGAVIVSGSNLALDPALLGDQWKALGGARVLVLQNEIPDAVNIAAAKAARETDALVILNAAPVRALPREFLELVDVLVVNRVEAEAMSGAKVTDRNSAKSALLKLVQNRGSVVITLGGDGLVIGASGSETTEIAALPVRVTSTHGAGDCFVGVLAASLARGKPLVDSCRFANERAAAFVSRA